jgi:TadE-like protein
MRRPARRARRGQAILEFAVMYAGVILPLTFMLIFVSQMLWIWHSVCDYTRDGARYAATHCWMADASNVTGYMRSHAPPMIDQNQFQTGAAAIVVVYYQRDLLSGSLLPFSCQSSECSAGCIPDAVSVSVANYQFLRFSGYFHLPPVTIPPFTASVPVESAGCDQSGNCLP